MYSKSSMYPQKSHVLEEQKTCTRELLVLNQQHVRDDEYVEVKKLHTEVNRAQMENSLSPGSRLCANNSTLRKVSRA